MGIFDIDENIENVKPSREVKFRKIFEEMRDGSQMVVRDTFEIGDRKISMVCIERTSIVKVGELPYIDEDDYVTSSWQMILSDEDISVDEETDIDIEKGQLTFITPEMDLGGYVRQIVTHLPIREWQDEKLKRIYKELFEMTDPEIAHMDEITEMFGI